MTRSIFLLGNSCRTNAIVNIISTVGIDSGENGPLEIVTIDTETWRLKFVAGRGRGEGPD